MITSNIYIRSAAQISTVDPDYRQWFTALEARRMGRLMKRGVATSTMALQEAGITDVDAIITGTGLGCIENTELFLHDLCCNGEQALKPTWFMQSTHNTLSSLIAIRMKCHAYNATYSHKGISFDCALHDALTRITLGQAHTVLVNGMDEKTETFAAILKKGGYVGHEGQVDCGEVAVSMVVSDNADNALCRVSGFEMMYHPEPSEVAAVIERMGIVYDSIVTGRNGWVEYDAAYNRLLPTDILQLPEPIRYKESCGECFSASAYGLYTAAKNDTGNTLVINIDGCGERMSLISIERIKNE